MCTYTQTQHIHTLTYIHTCNKFFVRNVAEDTWSSANSNGIHTHTRTHTHARIYTHTYIHTYIHTYSKFFVPNVAEDTWSSANSNGNGPTLSIHGTGNNPASLPEVHLPPMSRRDGTWATARKGVCIYSCISVCVCVCCICVSRARRHVGYGMQGCVYICLYKRRVCVCVCACL